MAAIDRLNRLALSVIRTEAGAVPSPCVSVCRIQPVSRLCEGCYRTLDEVAAWAQLDDTGKRGVWRLIAQRTMPAGQAR